MEGTVFSPALEGMKHIKSEDGKMLTKPFLDVCKLILPIIDKFGAAMVLVKSDIGGNITRLENKYLSNPSQFNYLYSMVQAEVDAKTAKASSSCTNGLLWLTRAMDFLVELFRNLLEHGDWSMSQACGDSYSKTLKKWHGWLASSSFTVAMKLAPDRKKFMDVIAGTGDIQSDIEKFCADFSPLLEENHKFLESSSFSFAILKSHAISILEDEYFVPVSLVFVPKKILEQNGKHIFEGASIPQKTWNINTETRTIFFFMFGSFIFREQNRNILFFLIFSFLFCFSSNFFFWNKEKKGT